MIDERVSLHLASMQKAATNALSIVEGISYDDFASDQTKQAATAMFLIVIGEAAAKISQVSPEFVASHQTLPWERMRGLRNRIVHDYETLHLPTIWATATESLPPLVSAIAGLGTLGPNSHTQTGT